MKARVEYIKLPRPSYAKTYRKMEVTKRNGGTIELTLEDTMQVISFKLPPEMNAKLDSVALRQGKSKSQIIREALARYLENV
ncbi:CopG-like transcriptional repressor [Sulfolobus virus Kamchatka 1]|uniref:ORF C81 n=1 Tax=Sulfolobus virus Kamchatka 1 TaxID=248496 RepID=Q6TDL9_9VIRU|nr:CopG-like transcriptional repressor [Sulfolobus virus Kamchatka 1]AAQ94380.1 ORF C81 [Sulfolobus virus Kamchatka 1]